MTGVTALGTAKILPMAELIKLLGEENVLRSEADLIFYSTDIYRRADVDAALVIQPGSVDELAKSVGLCVKRGIAVVPRGGGLSYTGGYLPTVKSSVTIDMARLDKIVEINLEDMYVVVEAGCNWRKLYEALRAKGVRTPYFGPMSGYASTVGGALSQGSIFLGSTQYGSTAESTLGLDVVLADGSLLKTGSNGGDTRPSPFFRTYGPDLTGPFLGDAGALGFKARATLRLIKWPEYTGFLTFTFSTYGDLLGAMSEVSRQGLAAECFGADPYIWGQRLWDSDITKDLKRLAGVVKSNRSLVGGIKEAVSIAAAGRRSLGEVKFAMNVSVDGRSHAEVEDTLARVRRIAAAGREVEATAPRAVRGTPFLAPDELLGPSGKRWAPIHGIAPHSRALETVEGIHHVFTRHADKIERLGIEWGYVTFAISTSSILIEPMLYWPGARELYHERMISPRHLAKLPKSEANPEATALVETIREELIAMWRSVGCVHLQIGKTYPYLESRQPESRMLLEGIKALVDPKGLINPGALSLGAP